MNIHFGLHFSSDAYIDLEKRGGIMFDECIANIDELVKLLNLRLGVHTEELCQAERQATYHAAFSQVTDKKTLAKSWEANSLGVSNECLKWRDALVACGWNANMEQPSERLQVMAEAEKHFIAPCIADHMVALFTILKEKNPLPKNSKIYVAAASLEALPPMAAELLSLLSDKGTELVFEEDKAIATSGSNLAKVQNLILSNEKEALCSEDNSIEVWNFPSALDAYRYIASNKDSADLYICDDTKTLDNVQRMMSQPTSGSKMSNAHPQIAQLFKLGITLFEHPFNIRNLVSWLMMPNHPLPSALRYAIAKVIVATGGIHNAEYKDAIDKHKMKMAEECGERQDDKIDEKIKTFIPTPEEKGVNKAALCNFLKGLGGWCEQRTNIDHYSDIQKTQFAKVGGLCNALFTIVKDAAGDYLTYRNVESWASSLYNASDFSLYDAQAGSRWTTKAYDIVDQANTVIWTDCYDYASPSLETEFLNEHEREELIKAGCKFWDVKAFNLAAMHDAMRPVLMAKQKLVLVTAEQDKCENTAKHPLIIRLEETYGDALKVFVSCPKNSDAETVEVPAVVNDHKGVQVEFNKPELVAMPDHESYSALENLIQYPIDYFMEKVLLFNKRASYELDAVETVKGNVAHLVIEKLFKGTTDEIQARVQKEYDAELNSAIEEKGAILLLKENLIEYKDFRQQLKENIDILLEIIRKNNLEVVDTEQEVNCKIGLLTGTELNPPIKGFVDMLLKTKDGDNVVFDFKWTSSKTKHKKLLEENASIQLALYDEIITRITKKPVVATAYFTMPWHKLYTTSPTLVSMHNVEHVEPSNNDDLLKKIINSYRYRRAELMKGTIGTEEGFELDENIAYAANTETQGLVPLTEYDKNHSVNKYSNFKCFKGKLK